MQHNNLRMRSYYLNFFEVSNLNIPVMYNTCYQYTQCPQSIQQLPMYFSTMTAILPWRNSYQHNCPQWHHTNSLNTASTNVLLHNDCHLHWRNSYYYYCCFILMPKPSTNLSWFSAVALIQQLTKHRSPCSILLLPWYNSFTDTLVLHPNVVTFNLILCN